MKKILLLAVCLWMANPTSAQTFEVSGVAENYKGYIGETIKAPFRLKNTSNKAITLVLRKADSQIGSTQKNYICPDGNCQDFILEEYSFKLEPGQSLQNFTIGLDAGLVQGISRLRYFVFNKSNPVDAREIELNFSVEEKPVKDNIFNSRFITIHDVYPNPVSDAAHIEYKLLTDQVKAKIVIHNILGSVMVEYNLPVFETRVKFKVDELTAGVYFYTLYLDNEGVMTRKLIVKR
jgi:hypothetical protein